MSGKYKTPDAFRAALDARVKREAQGRQRTFQRVITTHLMQRLVARVVDELGESVTLKGGMALELRLQRARATKDVDLRVTGARDQALERVRRRAMQPGASDWLTFAVDVHPEHPDIGGEGVIYQGVRCRAQAFIGGKKYGATFGVDIAVGDPMTGPRDLGAGANLLDIIGEPPLAIPLYPLATHVAEKLHAYTLPREAANTRLKDLIDVALIAAELPLDGGTLRAALETTFGFRRSHALPSELPLPPDAWKQRYPRERSEHDLPWPTIEEVHDEAARFLDPILAGERGAWNPAARAWSEPAAEGGAGAS